jgi:mannitol 2-dehydrogenase
VDGFALASAVWCRYCQGKTDSGAVIAPNDPIWACLQDTAIKAASDPSVWIGMKDIYGDVGSNPKFSESFASALSMVSEKGAEAAMKSYVESG